jgi:hypothetical protein
MKAARKDAEPRRLPKLDENEWNFSCVKDGELVAATYYEYARESKTIVEGLREKTGESAPRVIRGLPVGGTPISERFNIAFIEKIREQTFPLWVTLTPKSIPGKSSSKPIRFLPRVKPWEPWQGIAKETRRAICEELAACSTKGSLPFLPFNRCSDLRDLGLIDASGSYRCAEIFRDLWIERLRVEIDWSFNNRQICEAFKLWIKDNRPKFFPEPSAKGRDMGEWRAKLERLGLLRLRHIQPVEETIQTIAQTLPSDKRNATKFLEPGTLNQEAKKTLDDFHKLFPFLDSAEMPLSWPMK